VLGGRIEVPTAKGAVRLSIPPGSSSGTRLRLKSRGPSGGDIFVVLRIAVPRELDEESRELIARFAALNPGDPRDDG
jgi:curved DNA-binding protein